MIKPNLVIESKCIPMRLPTTANLQQQKVDVILINKRNDNIFIFT